MPLENKPRLIKLLSNLASFQPNSAPVDRRRGRGRALPAISLPLSRSVCPNAAASPPHNSRRVAATAAAAAAAAADRSLAKFKVRAWTN